MATVNGIRVFLYVTLVRFPTITYMLRELRLILPYNGASRSGCLLLYF